MMDVIHRTHAPQEVLNAPQTGSVQRSFRTVTTRIGFSTNIKQRTRQKRYGNAPPFFLNIILWEGRGVLSFIFRWAIVAPLFTKTMIDTHILREIWVPCNLGTRSIERFEGFRRRIIPPFHEVGFGSVVFVRFSEFFDRGIIRTTMATCWWLRHRFGIVRPSLGVDHPMRPIFLTRKMSPRGAVIGNFPPYLRASRFRSSEVRVNSEMRGNFSIRWDGALQPQPLRKSENVTKWVSTSQPKGFDAFVEADFWESSWFWSTHDSSLERAIVHRLLGNIAMRFRESDLNQLQRSRGLSPSIEKSTSSSIN